MKTSLALILAACALGPLNAGAGEQARGDLIRPLSGTPIAGAPATKPPALGAVPNPAPVVEIKSGDFVGFDQLAGFPLKLTTEIEYTTNRAAWADAQVNGMIPAKIKRCDGKTIPVEGYMIPVDFKEGKVTSFMLTRTPPACCYGVMPELHELINVRAKGPGAKSSLGFMPVRVRGVLHVGAQREGGCLTCIYRMDAEEVGERP